MDENPNSGGECPLFKVLCGNGKTTFVKEGISKVLNRLMISLLLVEHLIQLILMVIVILMRFSLGQNRSDSSRIKMYESYYLF